MTADYDQVPVHWTATKTSIRYGSKISIATKRSGHKVTVSGVAKKYTTAEEYKAYKTKVSLQRKSKTAKTYRGFKTLTASSSGKVSYSYSTTSKYDYRLVIKDASGVWGSTSAVSYR